MNLKVFIAIAMQYMGPKPQKRWAKELVKEITTVEARSLNGLPLGPVVMDEINHDDAMDVAVYFRGPSADDKAVQLEYNRRESMVMTRIVNPLSMMELLNIHILNKFGAKLEWYSRDFGNVTLCRVDGIEVVVPDDVMGHYNSARILFRYLSRRFTPLFKRRDALRRTLRYATLEPHGA